MNDFNRNTWCLLGLPFDAIDMQETVKIVRQSVVERSPCFISTPNLNFLIASQTDRDFRDSVINSDLSVADGMPLIWASRLLDVPLPERVAGSGLIEQLRKNDTGTEDKIGVFFFGGDAGVAEQACQEINREQGGLTGLGYHYPGFGSIEEMSQLPVIDKINEAGADFLIVSLGAKKGQAWIELNRNRLNTPVVSHLGAVVNFVTGNVKRAPIWMQKAGLEWLWRIFQEPRLWQRYLSDGVRFVLLFARRILPYAIWKTCNKDIRNVNRPVQVEVYRSDEITVISLQGVCLKHSISSLRETFRLEAERNNPIKLDLSAVPVVDGAFLGLCLMLVKHLRRKNLGLQFSGLNKRVRQIFRWNCVDYLL
jgi:N-acetylglucosaminyldiphosphoundecaprenol N-acetyl-beta-D-mannosaminyltransferase